MIPDTYLEKDDKEILKHEYSEAADKIRKTMVLMSFYKYGPAKKNFGGGRVDALKSAEECIAAFKKDGNTEHLLDAMNYLMFRYMYPYDGEKYKATDSDGSVKPVGTPINMEDPYDSWFR
jgi:hypothetical protein